MKRVISLTAAICAMLGNAFGQVAIDDAAFGASLGGWRKQGKKASEYELSGSTYRTFKPEVTPTPDGGIFVSIRIDHVRGIFSSNDYATLEITVNSKGGIDSARSNIAIQGRSISSDVILGTTKAGQMVGGVDRAVQIGTDLVANLSAKLLREKIVESGRVTFPAAVRHNYNLLYQAIRIEPSPAPPEAEQAAENAETPDEAPESPTPGASVELEIAPLNNPDHVELKPGS